MPKNKRKLVVSQELIKEDGTLKGNFSVSDAEVEVAVQALLDTKEIQKHFKVIISLAKDLQKSKHVENSEMLFLGFLSTLKGLKEVVTKYENECKKQLGI